MSTSLVYHVFAARTYDSLCTKESSLAEPVNPALGLYDGPIHCRIAEPGQLRSCGVALADAR